MDRNDLLTAEIVTERRQRTVEEDDVRSMEIRDPVFQPLSDMCSPV